jgi:hypothetical protein
LPLLAVGAGAWADVYDDIALGIDAATPVEPAPLPAGSANGCVYPSSLRFTMEVLVAQNHQTWLGSNASTAAVLDHWIFNVGGIPPKYVPHVDLNQRKKDFQELKRACAAAQILDLPFYVLLRERHHHAGLASKVQAAVEGNTAHGEDDLVFPLLSLSQFEMAALTGMLSNSRFLQTHSGLDSGGFGNLTYGEFYGTPADPEHFDNDKILVLKALQDLGLLAVVPCSGVQSDAVAGAVERDQASAGGAVAKSVNYCCDIVTRKCAEGGPGQSCSICGQYCCLGGVSWCY